MKKSILTLTAILATQMVCSSIAMAEQPGATEVRKILQSGTYQVEFDTDNGYGKEITSKNIDRLVKMKYTRGGNAILGALGFINPVLAIAGLFGSTTTVKLDTLYENGKYYQFINKDESIMAPEIQLYDKSNNPKESWATVKQKLSLPEQLLIFAPDDRFNLYFPKNQMPKFTDSGVKKEKDKEFPYDRYVYTIKNQQGTALFEKEYFAYYKDGKLASVEQKVKIGGVEYPSSTVKIKKLLGELPADAMKLPSEVKVYAAGTGDMNDLLDHKVLVETRKEPENEK